MLIDTHAHLYLEEFNNDLEQVIDRARDAGLEHILLPNISEAYIPAMNRLRDEYPGFFHSMIGLHPGSVKEDFEAELETVRQELQKGGYVAVGEIGTDLYWDVTFKEQQVIAFEKQISWALEFDLPIVIHARNSMELTIDIVEKMHNGVLKGVFHCFTGTMKEAERITGMGFYLGIGGVSTYKNSGLNEILEKVSLDHILLETDAPYLPPVPFRGKRNESSYIVKVAENIASLRGNSLEEVAEKTTENARILFRI